SVAPRSRTSRRCRPRRPTPGRRQRCGGGPARPAIRGGRAPRRRPASPTSGPRWVRVAPRRGTAGTVSCRPPGGAGGERTPSLRRRVPVRAFDGRVVRAEVAGDHGGVVAELGRGPDGDDTA